MQGLGKNINFIAPHTGLRIRLNFATTSSRLRDLLAKLFTKEGNRKIKYRVSHYFITFKTVSNTRNGRRTAPGDY